jgi:transcriptional regulator with XRE-family HTH domain
MIGLGRILAEAREARGATLDEVERETRISRRYLIALEEEDFAAFPVQVQARGFLRLYATYLELDPAELLALYPTDNQAEAMDGLVHGDRIFRRPRQAEGVRLPSIDLRRPPFVIAAAFLGVLLVCGLISALGASHRERAAAGLLLRAERPGAAALRVPDVRQDNLATALRTLDQAGITPVVIEVPTERVAAGLVIMQSPAPGSTVTQGSDVTLIVSRGRQ